MATPASRAIFSREASTPCAANFALRRGEELVSALLGVAAQGPPHLLNVATAHFVSLPAILRAASPFCAAQEPGRAR